jgi:hypothetical protein
LFQITADEHTITPPTLTTTTAPVSAPDPTPVAAGLLSAAVPVWEKAASNTGSTITLANLPVSILGVFYNDNVLIPTTDYTVSGKVITLVSLTVGVSDVPQILYYA